jgi:E3 ubiquitin-protein ligase RNF144
MDVTFMDPETAKIAVQLQLNDINDLLDGLYDGEDLEDGDARASFQIMRSDLQKQLQILEGQVLTLNILKEEHDNRLAFAKLLEEENQAISDHKLAMRLAGIHVANTGSGIKDYKRSLRTESECGSDTQWDMAKDVYAASFEHDPADRAPLNGLRTVKTGKLKANMKSKILGSKDLTKCHACLEVVPSKDTLTLECKPEARTYCRNCLVDLFISAMDNTTLFPPRCCKLPIPVETCRVLLPKELIKDFDLKIEELATPNPTHCAKAECSNFIRPKDIKAEVGHCVFCQEKTCVRCKYAVHEGLCPSDPHVQLLMDVAKRAKWQQCTKCKNMVELSQGCFHMR